jgi:hypothetical protein
MVVPPGSCKERRQNVVHKFVKPVAGSVIAIAMCFSSTAAAAATVPTASAAFAPASINPFVALSAYGTVQSQAAVCATAGAAAAAGQPAAGCVLPVVDPAVAAVPVAEAAPVAYAPVAGGGLGLGVGAILARLIAVAGLAAVLLSSNGKGRLPVTPD